MDIPIETSRRGHDDSGPEFLALSDCRFSQLVLLASISAHPSPLSVYRYSLLCSLALRLEFSFYSALSLYSIN